LSPKTTTDWDAATYDRLASPQEAWAREVLGRLPLRGDESVLDAGCGSGRVAKLLLERLPEGRLIGVDGSPSMIEAAAAAIGEDERVSLICSDLLELTPEMLGGEAGTDSVDVVFSNATFHWIADHERLFERLHAVLRPGGRFVAQCGGAGNVSSWREGVEAASAEDPFRQYVGEFSPWNFYEREETERRLLAAGFTDVRCWLQEVEPIVPEDPREYVAVVGLAAHHERLPAPLRNPFVDAVLRNVREPFELRYVRLNIEGRRRPAG
jgi:trans-aconitate 2-methyltransferase